MDFDRESFFSRRIHIDEEGYPVADGMRIDDESSLLEIFSKMRRAQAGDALSPLVTEWGGVAVSVEAFSSPLVIRGVELPQLRAQILGNQYFDFEMKNLQIDECGRLHLFLGEDLIEATFERQAQISFLMALDAIPEFAAFRERTDSDAKNFISHPAEEWELCYAEKRDRWDLGAVSPAFESLAMRHLPKEGEAHRVLVPGAGRGYEAQYLADQGFEVVAEDFAPVAKAAFGGLHPHSKVSYKTADFFGSSGASTEKFDALVELYFFCALAPAQRRAYFERCWERLKPGGLLVGLFFVTYGPGGPPYSVTPWELREYSRESNFNILHWQMSPHSVMPRLGKEFEMVLQKPF